MIKKEWFAEPVRVVISELEIHRYVSRNKTHELIINRVYNAIHQELVRPWREILATDRE